MKLGMKSKLKNLRNVDVVMSEYDISMSIKIKYIMHPTQIDNPIIQKQRTNTYYYYRDGLGSVIALADSTGAVKNMYKYYAFGGDRGKVEAVENRYQYTSREHDYESRLYYYRSRMYNVVVGRFIQKDKKRDGINWYVYVGNNGVIYVDPYGEQYEPSPILTPAELSGKVSGVDSLTANLIIYGDKIGLPFKKAAKELGIDKPCEWAKYYFAAIDHSLKLKKYNDKISCYPVEDERNTLYYENLRTQYSGIFNIIDKYCNNPLPVV